MSHVDPVTIAAIVDRAERIASGGRLMRLSPLQRRRLLADAVLTVLRSRSTLQPAPQPDPAPRR